MYEPPPHTPTHTQSSRDVSVSTSSCNCSRINGAESMMAICTTLPLFASSCVASLNSDTTYLVRRGQRHSDLWFNSSHIRRTMAVTIIFAVSHSLTTLTLIKHKENCLTIEAYLICEHSSLSWELQYTWLFYGVVPETGRSIFYYR